MGSSIFRGDDDGGDDGDDDGSDAGGGEVGDGVDGESLQWCGRALKTGGLRWCTALHCALCRCRCRGDALGKPAYNSRGVLMM